MRIAVFSDVHANLPALESFFEDLEHRDIDAIYCLGDLVGYNTWPDQVIAEVRKRKIPTIAGNHDLKVKRLKQDQDKADCDYAYHIGSDVAREYLATLPRFIRIQHGLGEEQLDILMVHGSSRNIDEYLTEDLDEQYVSSIVSEARADILFCGHTHKPYHRIIDLNGSYKHMINVGSVGKPKDGDPRGSYVVLTLNGESSLKRKNGIEVEFVRFKYDVERAAKAVELSPLPDEFADRLRKAY